ncbi:777_t:CDS:2, partial [Gigaspora rosea]
MAKRQKYIINLIFSGYLDETLHFVLNGRDFIIEIGQLDSQFGPHPSYICKCDGIQSKLCEIPTEAITTVYQQIFKYKSNFSGPEIMGYDTPHIVQEYLNNLPFRVFKYSFNKLRIWILGINKSHNQKLGFAGHRLNQHLFTLITNNI